MDKLLTGKNVLVTGGTGLVGGHLVEVLLQVGANVYVTHRSINPKAYFYSKALDRQVVSAIGDLADFRRVLDIVLKYEIAYIFHVAAQSTVPTGFLNPLETFSTNVMGTVNVLEAARQSPYVKGIVVASSDKSYGKDCNDAKEDQKLAGEHPYDVSKSSADLIARAYYSTYKVPVVISRFGNIFGPGDLNFNRIVPGIMDSIINKTTLQLRSDGSFTRDYVYVKDVAQGYMLLIENMEKIQGEAFNFSSHCVLSVIELIKKIEDVLGAECKYEIVNDQQNEIPKQTLNTEKAQKLLSWKPHFSFEEGIRQSYKWYKDYFGQK